MLFKLSMRSIVIALDGGFFEGSVHSLYLSVCPWMIDFGQPVFDVMFSTYAIKDMRESVFILFAIGKLDAIVSEDGMDFIRNDLKEVTQEFSHQ